MLGIEPIGTIDQYEILPLKFNRYVHLKGCPATPSQRQNQKQDTYSKQDAMLSVDCHY